MKRKRRILSLLLAAIMCLSVWSVPVFADGVSYHSEIKAGETVWIDGYNYILKFVPEKSGNYYLMSEAQDNVSDPYGYIYTAGSFYCELDNWKMDNMNQGDNDFCEECYFTAGEEYIIELNNRNGMTGFYFSLMSDRFITHQPSKEETYVELANSENVTYQWYRAATKAAVEITTSTAISDTLSVGSYDSETGWTPFILGESTYGSGYLGLCFASSLKAGDTMKIYVSGGHVTGEGIALYDFVNNVSIYDTGSDWSKGEYEITVKDRGTYGLLLDMDSQNVTVRAYLMEDVYEAVEGETGSYLQNPDVATKYLCRVGFEDGTYLESRSFTYWNHFTHQPTAAEPYVEGSFSDIEDSTYQWYQKKFIKNTELTPETVSSIMEDVTYSAVSGWEGVPEPEYYNDIYFYYELFEAELQAGDKVIIETDGTIDREIGLYSAENEYNDCYEPVSKKTDGIYEIVVQDDDIYCLYFWGTTDNIRVKAYIGDSEEVELEGETSAELTNPVIGESYWCEVITEGGYVISDIFKYDYAITHQPTVKEPYVSLNEMEGVTSQWYYADLSEAEKVTAEKAYPAYTYDCAYYEDGAGWHGVATDSSSDRYRCFYFGVELKEGQTLVIEADGKIIDRIVLTGYDTSIHMPLSEPEENGVYAFKISKDDFYYLAILTDNMDTLIDAWILDSDCDMEPLSGETQATLSAVEADRIYRCKMQINGETTMYSDWMNTENRIIHHPSAGEAYVEVGEADNVKSVQWYRGVMGGEEVKSTASAITGTAVTGSAAYYTEADGWTAKWNDRNAYCGGTYYGEFCSVDLVTGESVTVVMDGTVYGTYGMYNRDFYDDVIIASRNETDGVYTLTANGKGTYYLYAYAQTTDLKMRVYRGTMEYTAVEGGDSLRLTGFEEGYYRCDVEFTSGKTLTSRTAYLEETWQTGDINRDEYVTAEDALEVLKYVAHMTELDKEQKALADTNLDGEVTAEDALQILKYVAHMIGEFK